MVDIKEIIRILGFIQEYFENHADEQEPDVRKELFMDWSKVVLETIDILKAQEPIEPVIETNWETPSVYDEDVKVTENKCGACGAEIDKWDKYCGACGRAVKWK